MSYQEPTFQRQALGRKPANQFNDNPNLSESYVSATDRGQATVWGDVPLKNPDGSPRLTTVTRELDLTPRSPLKYGLIAGGLGAGAGALAGVLGSGSLGLSAGLSALGGALVVGGVAAGVAALAVRDDKVKVVWTTHPIKDPTMLGYHEYVGIGEKDGQRGYFHRFVPEVQERVIGTWQTPQAVHHK